MTVITEFVMLMILCFLLCPHKKTGTDISYGTFDYREFSFDRRGYTPVTYIDAVSEGENDLMQIEPASVNMSGIRAKYYNVDYDYAHDNFYCIPAHTALTKDYLNPVDFLMRDLTYKGEYPLVLVYHTHSSEGFADSVGDNMTITQVGDLLCKILEEQYQVRTIHITTQFDMLDGHLDRGKAYDYAEAEIAEVIKKNPEIDMVIDLHRDGVPENLHFVTEINKKSTAKVMLFNGISYSNMNGSIEYLNNPYVKDNLALTYQMYLKGMEMYPDFFRCIYIEAYRYNLHLHPGAMLIEAGAQTNTFEEVLNSMEPLANLIHETLCGN